MKRLIAVILSVVMVLTFAASCSSKQGDSKKLKIVTTIFPEYDWVMNLLGDNPAGAEVTVELLFDGAPTNNIKALTASETSATFANLPVYEGKQYGVAEASVVGVPAGFITTVAGSAADGPLPG